MPVQKAAVIGAGAMGSGIAQVLSQAGIQVLLKDVEQSFVDRGLANIRRMYDSRVKKEVMNQSDADSNFALVTGTITYDEFANVDLVIEAALEIIEVKVQIFQQLDKICQSKAILASNTSALSISEIASATKRPEKVVGMHFFNPAQFMKRVEVIPGVKTSAKTVETVMHLCQLMGKTAVRVEECPGFLVNRLLFPYLNEALYALQEGHSAEIIDAEAVAFGLPMGPLALIDMTGIDVCAHVNDFLYGEYGPRFEPAPVLKALMKAGHLGQKSGAGIFLHEKGQPAKKDAPKQLNPDLASILSAVDGLQSTQLMVNRAADKFDALRVVLPMFNEAVYAIQENVVHHSDVDVAMEYGTGLKRGLMSLAKDQGLAACLKNLETYQEKYGERFRPAWLLRKLVRANIHDFANLNPAPLAVH